MTTPIDYDALITATERDIEIATIGRKDGLVTHAIDQAQSLVDAIRALRAAAVESELTLDDLLASLDKWATEHTKEREILAYRDGWMNCRNLRNTRAAMAAQEKANG